MGRKTATSKPGYVHDLSYQQIGRGGHQVLSEIRIGDVKSACTFPWPVKANEESDLATQISNPKKEAWTDVTSDVGLSGCHSVAFEARNHVDEYDVVKGVTYVPIARDGECPGASRRKDGDPIYLWHSLEIKTKSVLEATVEVHWEGDHAEYDVKHDKVLSADKCYGTLEAKDGVVKAVFVPHNRSATETRTKVEVGSVAIEAVKNCPFSGIFLHCVGDESDQNAASISLTCCDAQEMKFKVFVRFSYIRTESVKRVVSVPNVNQVTLKSKPACW